MENAVPTQRTQTTFDCKPPAADQQPIPNNAIHTSESVTNDDSPIEEELSENIVYHLSSHSFLQPAQNLLIRYLRDQADIKPIRSSPSLDVIADLPSMLFSTLPLLISIWTLTSYCWIPLCGLMIWERMGSDVIYEFLCRILKGFGWLREVIRGTYEIATMMNSSAVMSKGARRVLPWADEQMNDEGALESLLYPHCGSL
ncbi:uncharacterized protein B0J16DRAFT_314122 [Fusarium flagelliforme]|uniref:uncharacterized protein n=1 Tax=Fusarium flagelliforme TaxID=2675880 RepID=UPI001E8E161C|nr:uncharacterized protein B0J16DRAFT_314122 [Fusarium flagelliforme]KAH7197803.1 hypothetical protein B0J16DRAFT_314122 [Fusarium flagelliforme]